MAKAMAVSEPRNDAEQGLEFETPYTIPKRLETNMQNYGRLLNFCLLNQEANRLAFETAKHMPFLFLLTPTSNTPVEPWQSLLFEGVSNNPLMYDGGKCDAD